MNNDDFDRDNSSKMTFVWPLVGHNDTFSYDLSFWYILLDQKFNRKRERCLTKS